MVVKLLNFMIYKIYSTCRSYLINHNCLINKNDFDYSFWSDGL